MEVRKIGLSSHSVSLTPHTLGVTPVAQDQVLPPKFGYEHNANNHQGDIVVFTSVSVQTSTL